MDEKVLGDKGKYFCRRGLMCASVSAGVRLRKEQASSSARTRDHQRRSQVKMVNSNTSQSVYGPLLKVFESDLCGWRDAVQIEPMGIFLLLVSRIGELSLSVADSVLSFGIDAISICSDHGVLPE